MQFRSALALATVTASAKASRLRGIVDRIILDDASCNVGAGVCADGDVGLPVLGHKSPDTDAVAGAIIRAWELRVTNRVDTLEPVCATPYINTDSLNRETEYVLDYFSINTPETISSLEDKDFAVVDTNNAKELPVDYTDEKFQQLHSVVDHHMITGTLRSDTPIEWDARQIASTGSILYQRAVAAGVNIPGEGCELNIAGLMLATIVSDTLVFRSSTTTQLDVDTAAALGPMAGIDDIDAFGESMLDAKSNIDGYTAEELVVIDSKTYDLMNAEDAEISVRVSVFETSRPEYFMDIAHEIPPACHKQLSLDWKTNPTTRAVLFFVIDVIAERAIFVPNPSNQYATDLVMNAFPDATVTPDEGYIVIPGVLSRKKQIMPALTEAALVTEYTGPAPEEITCEKFPDGTIKCGKEVIGVKQSKAVK